MIYVMPANYLILQYWTVVVTLCNADFIRFPCLCFTDILGVGLLEQSGENK
jgi:hypothetical protein